jgi:Zn-dependent metalloprotease
MTGHQRRPAIPTQTYLFLFLFVRSSGINHIATQIGGFAWEGAGRIWYETLRDPQLRPSAGFKRFAQLTVAQAGKLFGAESPEQKAVLNGWNQVGIDAS